VDNGITKQLDISLKRTLGRNKPTDAVSQVKIIDSPTIKPLAKGVKDDRKAGGLRRMVL
jgi:hypothetical protein